MAQETERRRQGTAVALVAVVLVVSLASGIAAAPGIKTPTDAERHADEATGAEAAPASKPAEQTQVGWILVQTPELARVFTPQSMRGVTFEKVQVTGHAPFLVRAQQSGGISTCAGSTCVRSGDFDLSFFRERADGTAVVVERHARVGDETGRVPPGAHFALVFLRTADTAPDLRGSGFVYLEGHPGSGLLPDWP